MKKKKCKKERVDYVLVFQKGKKQLIIPLDVYLMEDDEEIIVIRTVIN